MMQRHISYLFTFVVIAGANAASPRPNIILILADDLVSGEKWMRWFYLRTDKSTLCAIQILELVVILAI